MHAIFGIVILTTAFCAAVTSKDQPDTYTVAVVEYQPIQDSTLSPVTRLSKNTENYIKIIDNVQEDLDIIVFPESTLTFDFTILATDKIATEVPKSSTEVICNSTSPNYAQFFKDLACSAAKHNVHVVVNLISKTTCHLDDSKTCPKTGYHLYNTDVVFNRRGQVIAIYHKYNLFGEYDMTKPKLSVVTFHTELAEFGIFTCFDILFQQPALNLTRQRHVKNIIFPTMWFSELPFLTALQTQQMWAYENDVVLISAGANNPRLGSGGSGVFLGKKDPLNYTFSASGGTTVLIQKVPIKVNAAKRDPPQTVKDVDKIAKQMDKVVLKHEQTEVYTSKILDTTETHVEEDICHGTKPKFCCSFNIKLSLAHNAPQMKNHYTYRLIAFSGVRSFARVYNGGEEICGIIQCLNASATSCGQRFGNYSEITWPLTFQSISIVANFTNTDNRIQFPNSLLSSIRPIRPEETTWKKKLLENGTIVQRKFNLNVPQGRLMTFAIYGRDFSRDSAPKVRQLMF